MQKNIILIMVDQMRGDCLGVSGHPVIETPNLDMMARDGVCFDKTYSAVPSCIAARAAVMTGLSQKSHGRVGYQDSVKWNYSNYLAGEFSKNGYHTQCIGKMHVYPERSLCGFHNVMLHDGYLHNSRSFNKTAGTQFAQCDDYLHWLKEKKGAGVDINDNGLECNSWVSRTWMYEEELHPTNWVVSEGIDFLRRRDTSKPFFLKLSFVRPHSPLDPPKFYYDMYANADIPESPIGDWAEKEDKYNSGLDASCTGGIINRNALKRAKASYYGCITHIDHQIGRFLQSLNEYGQLYNSIILFVSDHGDLLGDHNLFRKAYPYEGSTRVPMIVYDPGNNLNIKKGQKISELVELRDIMPSLLDFADLDIPECVEGKSIKTLMQGKGEVLRKYIHGEHSFGNGSNHYIVTKKFKYIWYSQTGVEQLFNLEEDKNELKNLSQNEEYKETLEELRNYLIEELDGREEGYSDGKKLYIGKQPKGCLSHIL